MSGVRPAFGEYYIITFKQISSVAKVLAKKDHQIHGEKIEVYAAVDYLIGENQACLSNLAEIKPVFKDEFANLKFIKLSRYESGFKLNEYAFEVVILRKDRLYFEFVKSMETIEHLFQNYGPLIKSIDLYNIFPHQYEEFHELIATHCSRQNSLLTKLFYYSLPPVKNKNSQQQLESVFSRLNVLTILNLKSPIEKLVNACRKLTDLIIDNMDDVDHRTTNKDLLFPILQSNQHLKRLYLGTLTKYYRITPNILNSISDLGELEELTYNLSFRKEYVEDVKWALPNLGKLCRLKVLQFNCDEPYLLKHLIDVLVKKKVPIEELRLGKVNIDSKYIDSLKNLSTMKKLTIQIVKGDPKKFMVKAINEVKSLNCLYLTEDNYGLHSHLDINDLIEILSNLKELRFIALESSSVNFDINEHVFQTLVGLVRSRGNGVFPLSIKISTTYGKLTWTVPEPVVEKNRQWLQFINNETHL